MPLSNHKLFKFLAGASVISFAQAKDNHENCYNWASGGECQKNPKWMRRNCEKSCRRCDEWNELAIQMWDGANATRKAVRKHAYRVEGEWGGDMASAEYAASLLYRVAAVTTCTGGGRRLQDTSDLVEPEPLDLDTSDLDQPVESVGVDLDQPEPLYA